MKYPIFLIHGLGMGYRNVHSDKYWGRIPDVLRKHGYEVYLSAQDGNSSIADDAKYLATQLTSIFKECGAEKVNIIAYSRGGLEARFLASSLGFADKIASITTLSTPHYGSKTIDFLLNLPIPLVKAFSFFEDTRVRILGDKNPDTYAAISSFRTDESEKFNIQNKDVDTIYYQSYGFEMRHAWSDMLVWLPYLVVRHFDGPNDGVLSPNSVKWGEFKGVIKSNSNRGISHCDEIDIRRRRFTKKKGEGISDILEVYLEICENIENKGL